MQNSKASTANTTTNNNNTAAKLATESGIASAKPKGKNTEKKSVVKAKSIYNRLSRFGRENGTLTETFGRYGMPENCKTLFVPRVNQQI